MMDYTDTWHGCYDESWKDIIVDDAFAHPAKFAPGLIKRIFTEGLSRGWWKRGDLIGDPFGGIGSGGLVANGHGLDWIGVELEPKFVALAQENFKRWIVPGRSRRIVQGDSRQFAALVGGVVGVVGSPPYADSINRGTEDKPQAPWRRRARWR